MCKSTSVSVCPNFFANVINLVMTLFKCQDKHLFIFYSLTFKYHVLRFPFDKYLKIKKSAFCYRFSNLKH